MKNTNIIDFATYLHEHRPQQQAITTERSEELIDAIETLIKRLREHNPLKYRMKSDG